MLSKILIKFSKFERTKYFNTIQGWRIESVEQGGSTPEPANNKDDDDLPF